MTTDIMRPPEHMWADEWVTAKKFDPDLVFGYLQDNYGGEVPPYEGVDFASADSATVFRVLANGDIEKMTPQNVMAGGLVSIARKGFLFFPPESGGQSEGVEGEVEFSEQVITTEQPAEAVVSTVPMPPGEVKADPVEVDELTPKQLLAWAEKKYAEVFGEIWEPTDKYVACCAICSIERKSAFQFKTHGRYEAHLKRHHEI